jgi:hypothetical protein
MKSPGRIIGEVAVWAAICWLIANSVIALATYYGIRI